MARALPFSPDAEQAKKQAMRQFEGELDIRCAELALSRDQECIRPEVVKTVCKRMREPSKTTVRDRWMPHISALGALLLGLGAQNFVPTTGSSVCAGLMVIGTFLMMLHITSSIHR